MVETGSLPTNRNHCQERTDTRNAMDCRGLVTEAVVLAASKDSLNIPFSYTCTCVGNIS